MTAELLRLRILAEHDVFAVRQLGRETAGALGLEHQDQIRVATALSEVGRQLLNHAGGLTVTFSVDQYAQALAMDLVATRVITDLVPAVTEALQLAGRLLEVSLGDESGRLVVSMTRRLPVGTGTDAAALAAVREELASRVPAGPLDELAAQNEHLLAALAQVEQQRDELLRLNAELEETNRGVLALYRQLSDELEETNRGVVALYAELDQRSVQLRGASEAKTRFLANVSHELRAPVTAIIGLTRLLADDGSAPLDGEQTEQVSLIRTSAADLLALVNDLLDLAKAESGTLEPSWAEVSLPAVFGQLHGTLRALATRPDVTLRVDDPIDVPRVVTDEVLLMQVLRNLVTNGLKFTERGSVRLSARWYPADEIVELEVSDTGTGIPAASLERIFEEFYQVPGTSKPGGTGLGLPYARRLAGLLGGHLDVRSTVGEGSVFTVRLPRAPDPPAVGTPMASHVLVVDDDAAFRAVIVAALRPHATRVTEATDGPEALERIAAEPPDAVFLDLRMPTADGTGVLAALAADDRLKSIPVVVVSAEMDGVDERELTHALLVLPKERATAEVLREALRRAVG